MIKVDADTKWLYEKKAMGKVFVANVGFRAPIRDVPEGSDEMVYQTPDTAIYINRNPMICKGLDDSKAKFARFGLFVHQMVHTTLTDFDYVQMTVNRLTRGKAAFYIIHGACEDSAISEFAPYTVGGYLLGALKYSDELTFNAMPKIDDNEDGFVQFIVAVKQFAYGRTKGSFTNALAKSIFDKCLVRLSNLSKNPDPSERVDIAVEIYNESEPLWGPIAAKLDDVSPFVSAKSATSSLLSALGSGLGSLLGGAGPASGSGSVPDIPMDYSKGADRMTKFKKLTKAELDKEKDDAKKAAASGTGEKIASDEDELSYADGDAEFKDGDDKDPEDVDIDAEAQNTYDKLVQSELEIDGFSNKSTSSAPRTIPDFPAIAKAYKMKSYKLVNKLLFGKIKNPAESIAYYDRVVLDNKKKISHFVDTLKRLFEEDRSEKEYKTSGDVSMKRVTSGKISTRLFEKTTEPEDRSDVAVMLLVDESGSMCGSRIERAKAAAVSLSEAMFQLGLPFYVLGHTADIDGGDCVLTHYKHWDDTNKIARASISNMSAQCDNFDGYAIRCASDLLSKRHEAHKLLFVISDGQPACESYCGLDGYSDTTDAIQCARLIGEDVIGVAIGSDLDLLKKMYGDDYVEINTVSDIFEGVAKKIETFVKSW